LPQSQILNPQYSSLAAEQYLPGAAEARPRLRRAGIVLALCGPWLSPLASGPSAGVWPWIVTLACAALLLAQLRWFRFEDAMQAWIIAAALSAGVGVLQYFGLAPLLAPWVSQTELGTAFANLRQRNQFATLTNIGLVALWCWAGMRARETGRAFGIGVVAAVLAVGNAASSSRTGLVQLLVLSGWLWLLPRAIGRPRFVIVVALAAYAIAALTLPLLAGVDASTYGILARFSEGDACASRLVLWSNVVHLIALKPWGGWGWGNLDYAHYVTLYEGPRFCDILDNAHNLPLQLAVELGVPFAAAVCCGLTWWLLRRRPWRETEPTRCTAWAVLLLIGLHSLLEYPLWYGPFQMAVILAIAFLWRNNKPISMSATRWACGVAAFLLACCAYVGWDYARISQIYTAPERRWASYRDNTLQKIQGSLLFQRQVEFAALTTTPLTRSNAAQVYQSATALLHFSPEPRVIEKVIESAVMLGRDDVATFHLMRYRAAFAQAHAQWVSRSGSAK
jgi:O-antigen ligase